MRKWTVVGMTTLMIAASAGAGYAQDTTPTAPAASATAEATAEATTEATETAVQPTATKAWLGVAMTDTPDGVTVEQVMRGSSASAAGLQAGDIILSVNGSDIETGAALKT